MITGLALWSLLSGTTLAQEQVLIFQDTFEVSETETTDLEFENDEKAERGAWRDQLFRLVRGFDCYQLGMGSRQIESVPGGGQ